MFTTTSTHRRATRTPADTYLDEVLSTYVPAYNAYIRSHGLPLNLCIHASRITSAVLAQFGITGVVPVGVDMMATPPSATPTLASAHTPWKVTGDVYATGVIGTDAPIGDQWSGHVVTYVQAVQGRRKARIVDPTAGQFSAPAIGINVVGHVLDATDAFLKGRPLLTSTKGATIMLKRNARLQGFKGELADQDFVDKTAAHLTAVVATAIRPQGHRAA